MADASRLIGAIAIAVATAACAAACGRASYNPTDSGPDGGGRDATASMDAPASVDAVGPDAPGRVDAPEPVDAWVGLDVPVELPDAPIPIDGLAPDAFVDPTCAAVMADHTTFDDATVFDCAVRHQLGACYVFDASACGTCSCDYYVKNNRAACTGACDVRLEETGCLDFGMSDPPWMCSGDAQTIAACVIRQELDAGECTPCAC